jgi:hypothetical protein
MKIKTSDLTGRPLNWAVAHILGAIEGHTSDGPFLWGGRPCILEYGHDCDYNPSECWAHGGPIIEREKMDLECLAVDRWRAALEWLDEPQAEEFGPTPLIAAMRCFVASKLGDEVEVPEELA